MISFGSFLKKNSTTIGFVLYVIAALILAGTVIILPARIESATVYLFGALVASIAFVLCNPTKDKELEGKKTFAMAEWLWSVCSVMAVVAAIYRSDNLKLAMCFILITVTPAKIMRNTYDLFRVWGFIPDSPSGASVTTGSKSEQPQ